MMLQEIAQKRNIYIVPEIGQYCTKISTDTTMKYPTEEYAVGAAFLATPWKKLTIKEIQKISKKKSRSYVYRALDKLEKENFIEKETVGKSILYRLNLSSTSAQSYAGFLHESESWNQKQIPLQIIENIRNKIPTPFFILLVTGSYAKKKQTKDSDLDLIVICDDAVDPQKINAEIAHESSMSIPSVHQFVFTKKQFLEMLFDDENNYGKEAARYNFIFYGGAQYYALMNEAVKHGFRG